MPKQTYTSTVAHTTDAEFRAWGLQLSTALQACGLVKTTDTGQVNWATVTRAGVSANAGYEIYRFDDPLQSTRPIFLRFDFGTAGTTSTPRLMFTIGTGTNGAGTITGTIQATTQVTRTTPPNASGTTYVTHSVASGYFMLAWNMGGLGVATTGYAALMIERVKDDAGTVVDEGLYGIWTASGSTLVGGAYSWASTAWVGGVPSGTQIGCMIPAAITSTTVGSDVQVFRHFGTMPRLRCAMGCLTYVNSEFSIGSTFSLALVGVTAHTYLPLGVQGGTTAGVNATTAHVLAVLWED